MLKRSFDIIFSLIWLIFMAPFLLVTSVLIKREDGGPIFYKGVRIGRFGKTFKMLKFRTMVTNAEQVGGTSTPEDDPRITRIGKFLRRYKLDELPQLINVLTGDMSFIGPRPQVPWAVELYSPEEKKVLLAIRPGISDYASIKFRNEGEILRGSKDPDKDYMEKIHPEKMRLAMKYAENASFKNDIEILFKTVSGVLRRR